MISQNELIYIISISAVLLVIFMIVRALRKKRTRFEVINIDTDSDLNKMIEIRVELERLHDDIILTINKGITDMESRMKELKDLLMVSDEKILFLNSLMDETHGRIRFLEKKLSKLEKLNDTDIDIDVDTLFKIDTEIPKIEISSHGRRKML